MNFSDEFVCFFGEWVFDQASEASRGNGSIERNDGD